MDNLDVEKMLEDDYNNIIANLKKGAITPKGFELNLNKHRDVVVAAFHLGVMMAKFYHLDAKMGDEDVSMPGV